MCLFIASICSLYWIIRFSSLSSPILFFPCFSFRVISPLSSFRLYVCSLWIPSRPLANCDSAGKLVDCDAISRFILGDDSYKWRSNRVYANRPSKSGLGIFLPSVCTCVQCLFDKMFPKTRKTSAAEPFLCRDFCFFYKSFLVFFWNPRNKTKKHGECLLLHTNGHIILFPRVEFNFNFLQNSIFMKAPK